MDDSNRPSCTAKRLQEYMYHFSLNQIDLCKRTGIPRSTMSRYVSGDREPKQDQLHILSQALEVNPVWLMGYSVPMKGTDILIERYNNDEAAKLNQLKRLTCYYEMFMKYSKLKENDRKMVDDMINRLSEGANNES